MNRLNQKAQLLQQANVFLGGPLSLFEIAGRRTLMTLLSVGMNPDSRVLDIGCGCLRCGYWLINFLDPNCYFGIEPNEDMIESGIQLVLDPGTIQTKHPRFDHNDQFDFSVFGEKFDYFLARSIWSHASTKQIQAMLDEFKAHSQNDGRLIASYLPGKKETFGRGDWVGKSHRSNKPGVVRHSLEWIKHECYCRGLQVAEIGAAELNFGNQLWLQISRF